MSIQVIEAKGLTKQSGSFTAVNRFIIFPLFFLLTALFSINRVPQALKIIAALSPISYAVDAMRTLLVHQAHFGLGRTSPCSSSRC